MIKHKDETSQPIKIMLADDHHLLRKGFRDIVAERKEKFVLVHDTDNPQEAIDAYSTYKPDVVVMDVGFDITTKGIGAGLEAILQILSIDPNAAIVVLSQHQDAPTIINAYRLGALAYLMKNVEFDELFMVIEKAAKREKYYEQQVAIILARETTELESEKDPAKIDEHPEKILSEREFNVYKLIVDDYNISEIAQKLELSTKAVYNAISEIKKKLKLRRNSEIIKHAVKYGLY